MSYEQIAAIFTVLCLVVAYGCIMTIASLGEKIGYSVMFLLAIALIIISGVVY